MNRIARGKLSNYFKSRLGMFDYRRGWMKGNCPYCHSVEKFGVNLSQYRTNCFKCEANPSPIEVVMDIEGFDTFPKAWDYIGAFEEAEFLEAPKTPLEEVDSFLPEHFKLLTLGDSRIAKLARSYMKGRGFDIDELSFKGVGYCDDGEYIGRVIFPYYEKGKLRYFTARKFIDIGPKFKNPPVESFGIGKNLLIYNVDALQLYNKIYIVESITNALTLGDNAIALGGKVISDYQSSKILRSPIKKVVILLDPDATDRALKTGLHFVNYKACKVVELPEGFDVNDVGKKETMKYVKSTPYENYQQLYKRYLKHINLS